jgi:N-acetylglucosamine kinase-like BadF-type ATPase
MVPAHFGLGDPLAVSRALHQRQIPTGRLGELAPLVFAVSDRDPVAAEIVDRVADEVVAFARAALRRLGLTAQDPDVVLGGGLLRAASPAMIEMISRGVHEIAPDAKVLVSPSDPIVGAALLGLDVLGASASAIEGIRAELDAEVLRLGRDERAAVSRLPR